MDQVPTIELAYLTETQRQAYIIADNKLAENAGWDAEMLRLEFGDLKELGFDLTLTGFGDIELGSLLAEPSSSPPEAESDQHKFDEKKMIHCPRCEHEFPAP